MSSLRPPGAVAVRHANIAIAEAARLPDAEYSPFGPDYDYHSPGSAHSGDTSPGTEGLANTFFDFSTKRLQLYPDEERLLEMAAYTGQVTDWFEGLMRRPLASGIAAADDAAFPHCNQIDTMRPVSAFLAEALARRLDKKNGTVKRLENVVAVHAEVVSAHKSCTSGLRQFTRKALQFLPGVKKRDACFERLEKALNGAIQTGLFLRCYRRDLSVSDFESFSVSNAAYAGRVIDFNNAQQREDYLNTEVSVFIEPALRIAEMYFHTLLAQRQLAEHVEQQRQLVNTPPSSPLARARAATAARKIRASPTQFVGFGTSGENIFRTQQQQPSFPRVERVLDAAVNAAGKVGQIRNMQLGRLTGLNFGHSSSDSDSSPASSASYASPLSALSRHSSSSSAASVASARSKPSRSSSGSASKKTKAKPRARSQEARKASPTLKVRRKTP